MALRGACEGVVIQGEEGLVIQWVQGEGTLEGVLSRRGHWGGGSGDGSEDQERKRGRRG